MPSNKMFQMCQFFFLNSIFLVENIVGIIIENTNYFFIIYSFELLVKQPRQSK